MLLAREVGLEPTVAVKRRIYSPVLLLADSFQNPVKDSGVSTISTTPLILAPPDGFEPPNYGSEPYVLPLD